MEAFEMSFLDDWKEWSTSKKAISVIGVCCIGIIIVVLVGGAFFGDANTTPTTTLSVSDVAISSQGYGMYQLTGTIVPDKDYNYLEAQVIFYDSSGAVIDKNSLVWNMNDVHKNQTIKMTGSCHVSGNNAPAKAKLLIFDGSFSNDESKAIFTQEISM